MQDFFARTVSILLHPLIMPAVGLLLLLNSGTYLEFLTFQQKRAIFIILFLGTAILPLTLMPVIMLQRRIAPEMSHHRDRVMPLFITVIFYAFTWHMLTRLNAPSLVNMYTITAASTVLACALVSFRWKISLHMAAQGALAGVFLATTFRFSLNMQLFLALIFLAGGITGWARLTLKAHTPAQVYAGYLGGFAIAFLIMFSF